MKIPKFVYGLLVLVVVLLCVNTYGVFSQPKAESNTGYTNVAAGGFVVNKKVAYTDLLTTGVDISNTATGKLKLTDIIVRTDSYGMATGTSFQILVSGNDYGTSTVLKVPVSSLGRNQTFSLVPPINPYATGFASTSTVETVIEDGSKLVAYCTGSACSGITGVDGYVYISMFFDKMEGTSYIYE